MYASVQDLGATLRSELSFDFMRDLLFPVTSQARQEATAAGEKLTGFNLVASTMITGSDGVRGINELFEYDIGGQPDAFDQTVLTNGRDDQALPAARAVLPELLRLSRSPDQDRRGLVHRARFVMSQPLPAATATTAATAARARPPGRAPVLRPGQDRAAGPAAQALWDRLKFSVLLVGLWFIAVWYQMSLNPVLGFGDAARQQLQVGLRRSAAGSRCCSAWRSCVS